MKYRLIVRAEAEADIGDAARWYKDQQPGLGDEFIAEVEAAIERAVANPLHHHRLRRVPEIRRVLTKRFPYRIFFIHRRDAIVVYRVLHAARHDREWKNHIPGD